jgi:hypothetical protein
MSSPSHVTRVRSALRKMKEADGTDAVAKVCREENVWPPQALIPVGRWTASGSRLTQVEHRSDEEVGANVARSAIVFCGGLVGGVEACEILGIPKDQRGNLGRLEGLPEPVGETARGRVWLRSEMEAFAQRRREAKG